MIINSKHLFFLLIISQFTIYSQTDLVRWEKSNPTYQINNKYLEREYDSSIESTIDIIVKPVVNSYWFFISDIDGDNCAFHPSCSSFFAKSIDETNLFQATLMFFDRFTRDTNMFGRQEHYPRFGIYHFYDPVSLYTLDETKINYIPAKTYVEE